MSPQVDATEKFQRGHWIERLAEPRDFEIEGVGLIVIAQKIIFQNSRLVGARRTVPPYPGALLLGPLTGPLNGFMLVWVQFPVSLVVVQLVGCHVNAGVYTCCMV